MSLVRVEVINGVVDGNPVGSKIDVAERNVKSLVKNGFVKELPKSKPVNKVAAPKKSVEKTAPKKTKDANKLDESKSKGSKDK